jgi:hypothetical protein
MSVTFINATGLGLVISIDGEVAQTIDGNTTTPITYVWPVNSSLEFYIYELMCPPIPSSQCIVTGHPPPTTYTPLRAAAAPAIAWSATGGNLSQIPAGAPIAPYYNAPFASTWTGRVYVSGSTSAPVIAVCLNILNVRALNMGLTDALSVNDVQIASPGGDGTFTTPAPLTSYTVNNLGTYALVAVSGAGGSLTAPAPFSFGTCAGLGSATPIITTTPLYYTTPAYAWKQALTLTQSVQWHTVTLTVSVPAGAADDLGFGFETMGYPPLSAANAETAGAAFYTTADGTATNAPLVPYAPFNIVSAVTGEYLSVTQYDTTYNLGWTPGPIPQQLSTSAAFTFAPCSGTSAFQLCSLFAMGGQYPYPGGLVPLEVGLISSTQALALIPSSVTSLASACTINAVEWGVAPIFNGTAGNAGLVQLLARAAGTSTSFYMCSDAGSGNSPGITMAATTGTQMTSPTGFLVPAPDAEPGALRLCLLSQGSTCQLLTSSALSGMTYSAQYCTVPSAFGCGSGPARVPVCTLGATPAGIALCNSNQLCAGLPVVGQADVQAAKQFVANTCLSTYTTADGYACAPVGGTPTLSCVGWGVPFLATQCDAACGLIGSFDATWCDNAKLAFCNAPANLNVPACACINVAASSFPVAINRGLSFPAFQQELISSYGLLDSTQLFPQCWWGACDAGGAALTLDARDCPEYIVDCQTVIRNITSGAGTTININEACGTSSSSSLPPDPCSSFSTLHQRLRTASATQLLGAPAASTTTTSFQKWDYVVVVAAGCLLVLGIVLSAWFGARFAQRRRGQSKTLTPLIGPKKA